MNCVCCEFYLQSQFDRCQIAIVTIIVIHFQLCEEHEAKMKKLEELQERAEQLERRRETLERNKKIAEQSRKVREELLNRDKSESSGNRDSEIK